MSEESKGEVQAIRDGILFQADTAFRDTRRSRVWAPARPTVPRTNALPDELHSIRLELQATEQITFIPRKTEFILHSISNNCRFLVREISRVALLQRVH